MSNRPPGGQDWSFDAGHSNSADAASLISYMKMGRGHGSINAYIRVTGGFYLVLCDTLRSDDLEVQGNERSFMLDENTTKCFIIDRRIVITACGGTDRQDDLWNTIDIKYDDAKENFPDEELPDVHDIKGWIDEYMTTYKAFDPDGVDVFIIGYSRVHNTCIALISRDLSNGGLDLSLANYPYDQLHEVISSGFKDVLTIWVEMEIDKRINVETNEMSYNYALNFLKHGFLEASLNDLEVGGSFEGIILSLEQVKQ